MLFFIYVVKHYFHVNFLFNLVLISCYRLEKKAILMDVNVLQNIRLRLIELVTVVINVSESKSVSFIKLI